MYGHKLISLTKFKIKYDGICPEKNKTKKTLVIVSHN